MKRVLCMVFDIMGAVVVLTLAIVNVAELRPLNVAVGLLCVAASALPVRWLYEDFFREG